jgi:hypothetical protein
MQASAARAQVAAPTAAAPKAAALARPPPPVGKLRVVVVGSGWAAATFLKTLKKGEPV